MEVSMCRLFGLAAKRRVHLDFWLREAPDNIGLQSRRNPDGAGIGWFDGHELHVVKHPGPATEDATFRRLAESVDAATVVTHVRAATSGSRSTANTHPFQFDGLAIAHNGGFGDLSSVERHLGSDARRLQGDTDSERFAALIARETRHHGGDVTAGLGAAAEWLRANVPLYSLNAVVISANGLWALRYPDERALHYARRVIWPKAGAPDPGWEGSSALAGHQVMARKQTPAVVVASERIDGREDWLMLMPGELIHVDRGLTLTSTLALTKPPKYPLSLTEADPNREGF
jgi:glutamine amidotransferase